MEGHAKSAWKENANWPRKSTKIQVLVWVTITARKKNWRLGELSKVCSQIVLKCLYLARIGRLDSLWSVNKLARAVTKWTRACDRRLARLISYIHHTSDHRQYCHVGNTAQHCRLYLFQDSNFAGGLEDSESCSAGILSVFESRTFVPISWMCKKQTSVSHSSTGSEVISLDAGLGMDVVFPLHPSKNIQASRNRFHEEVNNRVSRSRSRMKPQAST